ncbi:MAG: domain / Band 7 family protein [Parcubacteria group bacterium]|nr:domain / Band 7 family protein [Parcubacteria group bacterium]
MEQIGYLMVHVVLPILVALLVAVLIVRYLLRLLGIVMIPQDSIGIVTKKFNMRGNKAGGSLADGSIIALNGESGIQAKTLPPGLYFGMFSWQYKVEVQKFITIPPGKVGVVEARDGKELTPGRIFAASVPSDSFQNAERFLKGEGQRGPQINVMPPSTYRVNTSVFDVEIVPAFEVPQNKIGIVTMSDGIPLNTGEIAGKIIEGHNGFQDGDAFIKKGGNKGLQEQVLMPGTYYLNPRLVSVELVDMFRVPIGYVGVIVSNVGEAPPVTAPAVEGEEQRPVKRGARLAETGQKGVQKEPKDPGVYAINPRTHFIELVPTTNIVLNWADEKSEAHKLDASLVPITVRSKDGFPFNLDVSQIIHISRENAALVIAEFGSMTNLVTQVLQPVIGNYFRNSAQSSDVIEFIQARTERQEEARNKIREAIGSHGVEAVDTLIGDISPPAELMKTLTDQKVAEREVETYGAQMRAEVARQELAGATAEANTRERVVTAKRDVEVATQEAAASIARAKGEAESKTINAKADAEVLEVTGAAQAKKTEAVGRAEAEVMKQKVESVGQEGYTLINVATALAENDIKLVPDIQVSGAGTQGGSGIIDALLGMMLKDRKKDSEPK